MGGLAVFLLVAALVFAGLAWVTIAALRLEAAQQEASAQAELASALRVALWRLDGRMLPALAIEDSRPYHHYSTDDTGISPTDTPLLAASIPEWMTLHFQVDPDHGWLSPQVLPATQDQLGWPDYACKNATVERADRLADLRKRYPTKVVIELFAARDRTLPYDPLELNPAPEFRPCRYDHGIGRAKDPADPRRKRHSRSGARSLPGAACDRYTPERSARTDTRIRARSTTARTKQLAERVRPSLPTVCGQFP